MERRSAWILGIAGLAAALTLANFGCKGNAPSGGTTSGSTGGQTPIELVFWHTQTQANKAALEDLCKKFNDANGKGITIKPLYQGNYSQLYQKISAGITARSLPDLAVAYESMVADYMKAGVVVPLDEYVSGSNGLSKDDLADIFPAFLETNRFPQFGNKLLSFPFTKSVLVNYVDLDALKKAGISAPPATWPEYQQAAAKMTTPAQGTTPAMKGIAVDVDASTLDGWIMAQGGKLTDASGANFNTPQALAVFTALQQMFQQKTAYQTRGFDYQADFGSQRAGMINTSSTQRYLFRPLIGTKFNWQLAMIPQKDPKNPVTVLYGANLCIFKTTKAKQDAAWEFLRWLSQKEQSSYWAIHSSYMPIRQSVAQLPEMQAAWQKDPQGKQAFDLIKYARPEPNLRGWQEVRDKLEEAMQSVLAGKKDAKTALSDLDKDADKILKDKA